MPEQVVRRRLAQTTVDERQPLAAHSCTRRADSREYFTESCQQKETDVHILQLFGAWGGCTVHYQWLDRSSCHKVLRVEETPRRLLGCHAVFLASSTACRRFAGRPRLAYCGSASHDQRQPSIAACTLGVPDLGWRGAFNDDGLGRRRLVQALFKMLRPCEEACPHQRRRFRFHRSPCHFALQTCYPCWHH